MTSTTPMNEPHGYKDPKTHKQDWNNPGKPKIKFDKKSVMKWLSESRYQYYWDEPPPND
jgi:hypothetical protein